MKWKTGPRAWDRGPGTGNPEPELLADLDGERVGRAVTLETAQIYQAQYRENSVNWCGVGSPNAGWAEQVLGEPDVERLWELARPATFDILRDRRLGPLLTFPLIALKVPSPGTFGHAGSFAMESTLPSMQKLLTLL